MNAMLTVLRRELAAYFYTPLAYVFIVIFLFLNGIFTFYLGQFFTRGQADLLPFFQFHPYLYLVLIPPVAMRLWAEERKTGTLELLMTLPITTGQAVLGKFLAAWLFTAVALALTFPIWITVSYLGNPDHGAIVAGYLGSLLMAGAYLAIGACISVLTKSQVIAFVLSVVVSFLFIVSGLPIVLDFFGAWAPAWLTQAVASLSFMRHFEAIQTGVIELPDIVYFVSMIGVWLYANTVLVEAKKAAG
jgi:ABC-2 type transport system permease protein